MKVVLYLLGLVLALPAAGLAGFFLVIDHAVTVRNPLKLFLDFLMAFGWGVPVLALVALTLVAAAFFRHGQAVGAGVILIVDVAAIVVILRLGEGIKSPSELAIFVPALLSIALAGYLVWSHVQATALAASAAMPGSSGSGRLV